MSSLVHQRKALLALMNSAGELQTSPSTLLPASDYFDLAGEEFGRRLLLTEGADGKQYCLRPDFTLPIAKTYMSEEKSAPAALTYLGPVFRQRNTGPTEFEQAGLELLAQPNSKDALYKVFDFSKAAFDIYQVKSPTIRLGSVALFEALLAATAMPDVWRVRLRRRFGNREVMDALLARLSNPAKGKVSEPEISRLELIKNITQKMAEDGLPLSEGRAAKDIADRYLEKQALAAAKVSPKTLDLLRNYLNISGGFEQSLVQIRQLFAVSEISLDGALDELSQYGEAIATRFTGAPIVFETSFSPRLHYYTGLVFEFRNGQGKTIISGGQYDRLLEALGAKQKITASGCAIWVKRLQQEGAK